MTKSLYDILAIGPQATRDAVQVAYRNQMGLYHPDKVVGLGADLRLLAEQKAKEINVAYGILRDVVARAAYDRQLAAEFSPPPPPPPRNDPAQDSPTPPRPPRNEQKPSSAKRNRPSRARISMPFGSIKESGQLALFAIACLGMVGLVVHYLPQPDNWVGVFLKLAIGLFTFIIYRGVFFLALWAVLFLDVRAPKGRVINTVSRAFRMIACVVSGVIFLLSGVIFLAGFSPSYQPIGQLPPFAYVFVMASLGCLALSGAGLCLASLMPTWVGRRFAWSRDSR
jgi:hypothetical protein